MTPDLMQEGEQRLASYQQREAALRTELAAATPVWRAPWWPAKWM